MEEKKFDKNSLIGFGLIFLIVMWMMYNSQKTAQKEQAEKAKKAQIDKQTKSKEIATNKNASAAKDSTVSDTDIKQKLQGALGSFAYSASLPTAKEGYTVLENDSIKLTISHKGGYISEAILKNYKKLSKDSGQLVELIKNNNSNFNLEFQTKDNHVINTKDLFFEPTFKQVGKIKVLSMKLKTGPTTYLEYNYTLKPKEYMVDFDLRSQGLNSTLNTSKPTKLEWDLKAYITEKSKSYENQNAEIYFEYEDGKIDYVGQGDKEETPIKTSFIAYKQHFFSSILMTNTPFETSKIHSTSLVNDAKLGSTYTKEFKSTLPLTYNGKGELDYKMNWYFGPTDYKILSSYKGKNLDKIIPLGWGIFGWINRFIFIPLFSFLGGFMPYGWAIIVFTILIKIAMSPITFKSFLSQAKMKVLRPEITELGQKYPKDAVKKQQETMKLYKKAGVNPMAGCIPALIQMPFLMASFRFFPSAFELRQKSFLWAEDLSSFDEIIKLPFNIPLYGDHISLFPILAAIAIFFYMKMTSGDNQMAQPQQDGMPDMSKLMKMMIYISPLMMLIFFNNYGSGLSLYNFMSNLITIGIMLVIKKYFIDSEKIHAEIQENKTKPVKEGKFQKKLREVMEQAEEQKAKGKK